jgi:hypothetical protein
VWGRENDYSGRYPELDELRTLPVGTILDGELVMLRDGRPGADGILPDFHALMGRHARRHPPRFLGEHSTWPTGECGLLSRRIDRFFLAAIGPLLFQ